MTDRLIEQRLVELLRIVQDKECSSCSTASTQTDLSIRDKYANKPIEILDEAFTDFFCIVGDVFLSHNELLNLKNLFVDSQIIDEIYKSHTHDIGMTVKQLIQKYVYLAKKKDGLSAWNFEITSMYRYLRVDEFFQKIKKKHQALNSTLPHVWYKMRNNEHYSFDVVRELKFFRQHLNGRIYNFLTNYYLFLESEGIPMASILSHPRVKAQVGIDFNVYHHCPELTRFLDSPIFQKLLITVESFADCSIDKIKTRIVSIAAVIYNLSRWSTSKLTTTDLVVNLTAILAICIPISVMNEFFKRIFSVEAQAGGENIRLVLKSFFLCLFILIVGKLPGRHTVDEFINRVHKFPQAFESIQKFWKQIDPITCEATNFIESELLGYDVIEEKTIMDEVQQWANTVEEYSDLYKKRAIMKDKKTMLTAGRIHVDGVRLLSKCLRLHYSRENADLIRSLLPTTYKISEIAIRSGADHSKPRREPLIVWFCGKSGVGKSTLTYPFLCDMMKSELGPNEELPDNWVQKIYARAPECEYFDGDPTDWMVYDDGFQIRDSVANPSPELFEIIRLGNMFPYMYHKASIEEKGNCFADVKGIVISSNIERIMAESIHCPEAVARRIRYAYKVELRPEYRTYYTSKDGKQTYKLDKSTVTEPNLDIYLFQPFDPLTGKNKGKAIPYKEMLLQCALALGRLGDEFVSYEGWLEKYRKVSFQKVVAQIGSEDRKCPCIIAMVQALRRGQCLTNRQVLMAQWLFGSVRKIALYTEELSGMNIEHLKSMFVDMPLEAYIESGPTSHEFDEFYKELYSNKFLAKTTTNDEGVVVRQVLLDKSTELIRPFRWFSLRQPIHSFLIKKYLGQEATTEELIDRCKYSLKNDWHALRYDPVRSIGAGCYETFTSFCQAPYLFYSLAQHKLGMGEIKHPRFQQYVAWAKSKSDDMVRFEEAEYVFRTRVPYVQAGAVVEELTNDDCNSVHAHIQRWRMRVKKIAQESWAYTCANWPNLLLYAVGAVSATYTMYRMIATEEDEDESHVEAQSLDESGSNTQPRPRARVQHDDDSSGQRQYNRNRPRVQNMDESSGKHQKSASRPRVQNLNVDADFLAPEWRRPKTQGNFMSAIDNQLYSILDSRVLANTLMAYISPRHEDSVQRRLGHIVALRGSLFMMNYHFVLVLKEYQQYDVIIRQGNSVYHRCSASELAESYVRVGKRDLVVFELKRKGVAFGDLVKHIQTKSMSYSHNVQTVVLARHRLAGFSATPNLLTATDAHLSVSPISIDLDMRGETIEVVNAESWLYTGVTQNGDCGALLLLSNNRVPAKIVGVHNAFDPYRCKAIAVPLYREEIEEAMGHFQPRLQYGWRDDMPFDPRALEFDHGENFNVVRCEVGSIPSNCRSRLAKSPIHGELIETVTKPGYLRPFTNTEGEVIDPAKLARAKWGYHLPVQDMSLGQRATRAVVQVLMKEHRPGSERYRYPLTTEEAIVGVEGVEGLNSINKVSSPGYPYVFNKVPGRGKTGYFGQWEFDLTLPGAQQIIREVEQMEVDMLNNRRPFVVWIDTLKDARISIEKANRGKTRIFSAGPMAYTILYRKYFLPPIAHVMWNRIENGIAVGINPTSPEWHTLALKLKSKGKHCIAGDYACFDGKAPTEGYLSSLEFFKEWYTEYWSEVVAHRSNVIDGYELSLTEFLDLLDKIFLEVVNHIHLMEYEIDNVKHHLFYSVCNGQPSGNPGTAKVNSAQGLWMMIRSWLELTKGTAYHTIGAFFKHVYVVDYGDDVALNVSSEAIPFFNQNTLTSIMRKLFDIEFTDEKKTGASVPDSRSLSEISFLKRRFEFNEDIQMYVSPMEVDTLLDILNWVRTGAEDPRVITINNIESVAAELALVSQAAFDEWIPKLKRKYAELSWRVNKEIFFDTRLGYLLAFRNANFKSVEIV